MLFLVSTEFINDDARASLTAAGHNVQEDFILLSKDAVFAHGIPFGAVDWDLPVQA